MKPINIFSLTRIQSLSALQKAERQMSERRYFLKIKQWETDCLRMLTDRLFERMHAISDLYFYYSFQIPKLGKEFDLLCVDENQVINIELKSMEVSDEKIKNQLMQNRQYLALLGKSIRSYTYIASRNRLVRLTNSGRLVESDFESLCDDIRKQENRYTDHLEKLFVEEKYLISPITDPDKFLRREYFLTAQQRDIKNRILRNIREKQACLQAFTGLPGTGKTLLLYDLAMQLSEKERVCVLHFGSYPEEMLTLNERLKRIDFLSCAKEDLIPRLAHYCAVLVDEGHRIGKEQLQDLLRTAGQLQIPVIFSYDCEDSVSEKERFFSGTERLEKLKGMETYRLTNRIRMNVELSSFIGFVMKPDMRRRRKEYPDVSVAYSNNSSETDAFLKEYKGKGYIFIRSGETGNSRQDDAGEIDASLATCKEFERVVMRINENFVYDDEGYLTVKRDKNTGGEYEPEREWEDSPVRILFHGLSRAKSGIAIIAENNPEVFDTIMAGLQGNNTGKCIP